MRLTQTSSQLLIIDPQEKLMPAIADRDFYQSQIVRLVQVADALDVPVWATEHCVDKIGPLCREIRSLVKPERIMAKRAFGALGEQEIRDRLLCLEQNQIVVAGVEAHVCVMQSALGLLDAGREVFIAADACGSRFDADRELAFRRLERAGACLTSVEAVAFEWMGSGDHPVFRSILSILKGRA